MKDYYKILGVNEDASADEIRERWVELMREFHPDQAEAPEGEANQQRVKEINEAYQVLKHSSTRVEYDLRKAYGGRRSRFAGAKLIVAAGILLAVITAVCLYPRRLQPPVTVELISSPESLPLPSPGELPGKDRLSSKQAAANSRAESAAESKYPPSEGNVREEIKEVTESLPATWAKPVQKEEGGSPLVQFPAASMPASVRGEATETTSRSAGRTEIAGSPPGKPGIVHNSKATMTKQGSGGDVWPSAFQGFGDQGRGDSAGKPVRPTPAREQEAILSRTTTRGIQEPGRNSPKEEAVPAEPVQRIDPPPGANHVDAPLEKKWIVYHPSVSHALIRAGGEMGSSQSNGLLTDETEINQFLERYRELYVRKDTVGFLDLFSATAIQNEKQGIEDIRRIYRAFFDQSERLQYLAEELSIEIYRDAAEIKAQYQVEQVSKRGGEKKLWTGPIRWIVARENGVLKIVSLDYQNIR